MDANKIMIDKSLLKLIQKFAKNFWGLSQEEKLTLSTFLSQGSREIVSKELMLKCFQAPSEVTPEERSKIIEYQKALMEDITCDHLASEGLGRLGCSDFTNVARVSDHALREVARILKDDETDLLTGSLDLGFTLQEEHSGESYDQKDSAKSDNMSILGNQGD